MFGKITFSDAFLLSLPIVSDKDTECLEAVFSFAKVSTGVVNYSGRKK